ncbi:DUF262 domain-containing protein [Azospirillum melinis]
MANKDQKTFLQIDDERKERAENEIRDKQKITDYDIREYPIEVIVAKFRAQEGEELAELYIPDYQRELVWSNIQQSRFIESIMLNLPIPYLFVADTREGKYEGLLEIVDGSQRVRTLDRFVSDKLQLTHLEVLPSLNDFRFSDLPRARQLRFLRKTLRMIELTEQADEEARRMMFDRLNSGGTKLVGMEQRMGANDGPFLVFLREVSKNSAFKQLCPISEAREKRREYEELALRFFAYLDRYTTFEKRVDLFLTEYLKEKNENPPNFDDLGRDFNRMLHFVAQYFPCGFKKSAGHESVPRIRFEAIAVGTALALKENPELVPLHVSVWLDSVEFKKLTRSDASNSRPRLMNRIHFVRDNLLGRPYQSVDESQSDEDAFASPDLFEGLVQ